VFSGVGVSTEGCGGFIQDLSALAYGLSTLTWGERLARRHCACVPDMDGKSIRDGACTRAQLNDPPRAASQASGRSSPLHPPLLHA